MSIFKTFSQEHFEAGIDEAGRGCLAGPVVAAAVILPEQWYHPELTDSKLLTPEVRTRLKIEICQHAIAYGIGIISPKRIDEVNIANATFEAMHQAIEKLEIFPQFLLIDGNRFTPYKEIPFECIVKGDQKYAHIAAASILAKTTRDELMCELGNSFPHYGWEQNKGYPTKAHKQAIHQWGPSPHHRKSFRWTLT